ncbi:hypothetical protein GCM10010909_26720 [Acidocella aquatica]|uniref:Uncharacterized protein n=1 Tax=Acidocella aquatica TaxID=1922313 RepID=A0ABQ6A7X9_9PROT|nr:hypothetical protein [Acidocella aquatica]GLR67991.1 hypothetical protein GCM10010909_26720 [Acidocella aquatica]
MLLLNVIMGYVFPYKKSGKLLLRAELTRLCVSLDLFPVGCLDELDQLGIIAYNHSLIDLKNSRPTALADMVETINDIAKNITNYLAGQSQVTDGDKVYNILEKHKVVDRNLISKEYTYERGEYENMVRGAYRLNEDLRKIIAEGRDKLRRLGKEGIQISDVGNLVDKLKAADNLAAMNVQVPRKSSEIENAIVFDFEGFNSHVRPNALYFKVPHGVLISTKEKLKSSRIKTHKVYEYIIDELDEATSVWERFQDESLSRKFSLKF